MKCELYRSKENWHDHTKAEAANWEPSVPFETIHGPKVKFHKLTRKTSGISWRIIFYFPSGEWWALDIFSKLRKA